MRRSLGYADAVRILGGGESRTLRILEGASTGALAAFGLFDLFEFRQEVLKYGNSLLTGLSERLRGIDRLSRTERLLAAHAVVVITAYFEALDAVLPAKSLPLTAGEQLSLAAEQDIEIGRTRLAAALADVFKLRYQPADDTDSTRITICYRQLSWTVEAFVAGSALWDRLDETEQARLRDRIRDEVPENAVVRYEEHLRRLAAECAEFAIWRDIAEHRTTREAVCSGLSDLESLLATMASGRLPDARRAALSRAYRVALDKPITQSSGVGSGLRFPTLAEGYVDHRFRASDHPSSGSVSRESWWADQPVRDDLPRFLAALLTSRQAQESPLLVLGHPGSGKSVLTRILAARLPAEDFLTVRVELRQVATEADLQDQIEAAIRTATGEHLQWPRLVESADGALPVVILDGFDELLQATGVAQTDFLVKVAAFQEREADQGRPVAVVVTSRTAVADRAVLPSGTIALRLEPFDAEQVTAWLEIWRHLNEGALSDRGLRSLPPYVAVQHLELAEQPLLLLMLALYDTTKNALQRHGASLDRTELYEQLLSEFARREVAKDVEGLPSADLDRLAETELIRLSVAAFAMFNRQAQWIDETSLNADLSALLPGPPREQRGFRAPLTPAQTVVGRFFFVHESQATRDGDRLRTYEFLHATFGEFLVARLVMRILAEMASRETAAAFTLPGGVDDSQLHALTSYEALASRTPIITFLSGFALRLTDAERATTTDLLLRLHHMSLDARTESVYAAYKPRRLAVTQRHAAWNANLVLLTTIVAKEVTGSRLFPGDLDRIAYSWRNQAMLWRSQLSYEGWNGMVRAFALERLREGEQRDIRLRLDHGGFEPGYPDLGWTYDSLAAVGAGHTPSAMLRKSNFTIGKSADVSAHSLQPVSVAFQSLANLVIETSDGRLVTATHALLAALAAPFQPDDGNPSAYEDLVRAVTAVNSGGLPDHPKAVAFAKTALAVLLTAAEWGDSDSLFFARVVGRVSLRYDDEQFSAMVQRLGDLRDLMAADAPAAALASGERAETDVQRGPVGEGGAGA